ncbi:putative RNA recognition motif. (A.k.a. RRM, RBD, or RNP domain) [Candidatus Methylacidithermus pantelleriae]|uniref:Putative RNA recognition motif. (A.k.a. RRM, RBD, or RNP domain) n=1 Tax=Candidatus Methylacidithermus pantelleriae TaxID=2744239 RepID=A0A8J2BRV9_9BACT|nr:putative RNA recognition motif. (A.k.a. RRM, RBD, or RNP domain) [Candidatus Methylacidithermus pantelleriae]
MSGNRSKNSSRRRDRRAKEATFSRTPAKGGTANKPKGLVQKIAGLVQGLFGKGKPSPTSDHVNEPEEVKKSREALRRSPRRDSSAQVTRRPAPPSRPSLSETSAEVRAEEITTPRLYVGNLSYEAGESDLFELFSQVGPVRNVQLIREKRGTRSKGFGFVEMADVETAKQAIVQLHRKEFMGRELVVSAAKGETRRKEAT